MVVRQGAAWIAIEVTAHDGRPGPDPMVVGQGDRSGMTPWLLGKVGRSGITPSMVVGGWPLSGTAPWLPDSQRGAIGRRAARHGELNMALVQ
ncbi:hypothetical protein ACWENQ_07385 [Nonomuraea sp. NPDC004354]